MIWFKFYTAWGEGLAELSDTEAGRFVKAVCEYADDKDIPTLTGNERVLFAMARKQIEQDKEKNERTSAIRAEVGRMGGINSSKQRQAIACKGKQKEAIASDDKQLQANAFNKNKELRIKNQEEEQEEELTPAPAKPAKHRHGDFGHVLLTDDEYRKLQEQFEDVEHRIQNLDNYLENNPKKHYANHYLTILTWARKDDGSGNAAQPKKKRTFADIASELNGQTSPVWDIDL